MSQLLSTHVDEDGRPSVRQALDRISELAGKASEGLDDVPPDEPGTFAVAVIGVSEVWQPPKGYKSVPPAIVSNVDWEFARETAIRINSTHHGRLENVWALVVRQSTRSFGVVRLHVHPKKMPSDPRDLPTNKMELVGVNLATAESIAFSMNKSVLRIALHPKRWAVVVYDIHVERQVEGCERGISL